MAYQDIHLSNSVRAYRAVVLLREVARVVCLFGAPVSAWVLMQSLAPDQPSAAKFGQWIVGTSVLFLTSLLGLGFSIMSMRPVLALGFLLAVAGPAAHAIVPYAWATRELLSQAIVFGAMAAIATPFLWAWFCVGRLSPEEKSAARPCQPIDSLRTLLREFSSSWPGMRRSLPRAAIANALTYLASITLWIGGAVAAAAGLLVLSLMPLFLRTHGLGEVAMQLLVLLALLAAIGTIQSLLRGTARWFSRASYADKVTRDMRPPILFLRSFQDDQVLLKERGPLRGLLRRVFAPGIKGRRLDHFLVEGFSRYGPSLALGSPGEKSLPFGAARVYCTHETWKAKVAEIANRAGYVILVADSTPGVEWELSHFLKPPWREKTLFVVAPKSTDVRDAPTLAAAVAGDGVPSGGEPVLACYWDAAGRLKVLRSDVPRSPEAFIVAMQVFFRERAETME